MNKNQKLNKYNQVLLAIAGTIGIILLFIMAVFAIHEIYDDFFRSYDYSDDGILAIEETDQLRKDSLRKQIISFNKIQVIDSLSQTYVLPVTQANLAEAESTDKVLGLISSKSSSYEKRYQPNIYNNLMLFNSSTDSSKIIFENRISIEDYIVHESGEQKYIVIAGCSIDSNKDKLLNSKDLQELFIYDLQNESLHKIAAQENYTTLNTYQPNQSNDLIVHFGIDRNDNGRFENQKEPMIFYKVNLETMSLTEFVYQSQIHQLQKLLEGN